MSKFTYFTILPITNDRSWPWPSQRSKVKKDSKAINLHSTSNSRESGRRGVWRQAGWRPRQVDVVIVDVGDDGFFQEHRRCRVDDLWHFLLLHSYLLIRQHDRGCTTPSHAMSWAEYLGYKKCPVIMLATFSGERNVTVWCPSVRLSVCPIFFLTLMEHAAHA